jgi:hypothetical protein
MFDCNYSFRVYLKRLIKFKLLATENPECNEAYVLHVDVSCIVQLTILSISLRP